MEWITKEEVEKAAKESLRAAILCSIEHHQQLITASVKEIGKAWCECKVSIGSAFCALCQLCENMGKGCAKCPIWGESSSEACCIEWRDANDLFPPDKDNLSEFRVAESRLIARLYKALADCPEEAVKKQVEKPEIKHGHYRVNENGSIQLFFKDDDGTMRLCQGDRLYQGSMNKWVIIEGDRIVRSGNIYDLIKAKKDEGEDLREFSADVHTYKFDLSFSHAPIYIAGNWHTFFEAKRIARNLLRLIATAERDKAKDC